MARGSSRSIGVKPGADLETLKVRVRKRNPAVERPPPPMPDEPGEERGATFDARASAEESQGSIYDDLERTLATVELANAHAALAQALGERAAAPSSAAANASSPNASSEPGARANAGRVPAPLDHDDDETVLRSNLPRTAAASDFDDKQRRAPKTREMRAGAESRARSARAPASGRPREEAFAPELPLTSEARAALAALLEGRFDQRGLAPSLSPKRTLEHLLHEQSYRELTPRERGLLLSAIAAKPRDISAIKAALALLKTGAVALLAPDDREQLFLLFAALGPDERVRLAQLAARPLAGRSALSNRDRAGMSTIEHLRFLAARPDPKAAKLLLGLLGIVAAPGRLPFDDGNDGVLGLFEFALAELAPAELTRLWRELLGDAPSATLAGPAPLTLGARLRAISGAAFVAPGRNALENLGALIWPSPRDPRTAFVTNGGRALDSEALSRGLALIFGTPYVVMAGASSALRALEPLRSDHIAPSFVSVRGDQSERLFVFDHLDAEWLYLRAPHGSSTKRAGAWRQAPRREVVAPELNLERMRRAELAESLGVALLPKRNDTPRLWG